MDRSNVLNIRDLRPGSGEVTVIGKVMRIEEAGFGSKKRLSVSISDGTGFITGVWFKGLTYFKKRFKNDTLVSFFGPVKSFGHQLSMTHPDVEDIDSSESASTGIIPVYPSTNFFKSTYISSLTIQRWITQIRETLPLEEYLPEYLLRNCRLPDRKTALRFIHEPSSLQEPLSGQRRFKFDELLLFQMSMARLRKHVVERAISPKFARGVLSQKFVEERLSFEFTEGQKETLSDIYNDVTSGRQMNRLLQGDVGSGKTVVAVMAMLWAVDSGFQAAIMAPTEILAEQHFHVFNSYLEPLGLNVRLLSGNQSAPLRRDLLTDIGGGQAHIVIGTHALIQEKVKFHKLGLVVIDEQHRFGVMQRSDLLSKGNNPHVLVMSATPIPRSLALTVYSDLDVSLIKGLPSGRKPISTAVRFERNRDEVYGFVRSEVAKGGQIYIVYPLVEESEAIDLKNATAGFEQLRQIFPDLAIGLVHGRMKSDEKEIVMKSFTKGEIDILVSTTVIEVGVNVPNASVMLVEHAERFGLSQLHQLRGRIGRGERKSYCILMTDVKRSKDAKVRLDTMARTSDGFEIAEVDLKLRGPGDFLGTKQSGLPDFRFADIVNDTALVHETRELAFRLLRDDPDLSKSEHQELKRVFTRYFESKAKFFSMG